MEKIKEPDANKIETIFMNIFCEDNDELECSQVKWAWIEIYFGKTGRHKKKDIFPNSQEIFAKRIVSFRFIPTKKIN